MFSIGSAEVLVVLAVLALSCLPVVVLVVVLRSSRAPVRSPAAEVDERRGGSAGRAPRA